MIALLQADLFKFSRRSMGWAMLWISVVLTALIMIVLTVFDPGAISAGVGLTDAALFGAQFIAAQGSLGAFLMIVLGASMIGSEYSFDTWKTILIRHSSRTAFIITKWIVLLLSVVIGIAVLSLVSLGLSVVLGVARTNVEGTSLGAMLLILLGYTLNLSIVGSVALFGAAATRSTVGGVVAGILWMIGDNILSILPQIPTALQGFLYTSAGGSLILSFAGETAPYSLVQSVLVLLAYLVIPLIATVLLFNQRDVQ